MIDWILTNKQLPELDNLGYSEPCLIVVLKNGIEYVENKTYILDSASNYDPFTNSWEKIWRSYESNGEYADDYSLKEVVAYFPIKNISPYRLNIWKIYNI